MEIIEDLKQEVKNCHKKIEMDKEKGRGNE